VRILLVDDHPDVRLSLAEFLGQIGHECTHASSGTDALAAVRQQRPGLVISDLRMPGMDGLSLLSALRTEPDAPPIALMTAFGDAGTAIEAMRRGAVDYLRKPIDVRELHRLVERIDLASQTASVTPAHEVADGVIVAGADLEHLLALADRIHAAPDLPCLIEGETGTGKELFARRVHHGGDENDAPFVALNCTAIAPGLFESELFGYAPGAFTGANPRGAEGKISAAAGGTLFLDEIGDLPLEQQAKLLRLLEDRSWYPVGDNHLRRLQARIVCATNANLLGRVQDGRFREDLFYRLKVCHLRLPPLRERADGVLPLTHALLKRASRRRNRSGIRLSAEAELLISAHPWPGNVRQLTHTLEQACLLSNADVISVDLLKTLLDDGPPSRRLPAVQLQQLPAAATPTIALPHMPPPRLGLDPAGCNLDAWHRAIVAEALRLNHGSPVKASIYLGTTRKVLYTLRKRYGLFEPDDRDEE
jgi:two-component system, NtrC family, response regulator AtoC